MKTVIAICAVPVAALAAIFWNIHQDGKPSPGGIPMAGSGGFAEVRIIEVGGHRFAVLVGYSGCAITEVTGASATGTISPQEIELRNR